MNARRTSKRRAAATILLSRLARARKIENALRRYLADLFSGMLQEARRLARITLDNSVGPSTLLREFQRLVGSYRERAREAVRRAGEESARRGYSRTVRELRKLGGRFANAEDRDLSQHDHRELMQDLDLEVDRKLEVIPERLIRSVELLRSNDSLRPLGDSLARRLAKASSTYAEVQGERAANEEQGTGWWGWKSRGDLKVRRSHRHVNGEVRRVGALFSNGLRWPRDRLGVPAETAECRCGTKPVRAP